VFNQQRSRLSTSIDFGDLVLPRFFFGLALSSQLGHSLFDLHEKILYQTVQQLEKSMLIDYKPLLPDHQLLWCEQRRRAHAHRPAFSPRRLSDCEN
jgi:hypothetical protein